MKKSIAIPVLLSCFAIQAGTFAATSPGTATCYDACNRRAATFSCYVKNAAWVQNRGSDYQLTTQLQAVGGAMTPMWVEDGTTPPSPSVQANKCTTSTACPNFSPTTSSGGCYVHTSNDYVWCNYRRVQTSPPTWVLGSIPFCGGGGF